MDLVPSADGTIDVEKLKLFMFTSNILTVYVCTVLGVSFGLYECTSTCTYCAIQKEVTCRPEPQRLHRSVCHYLLVSLKSESVS